MKTLIVIAVLYALALRCILALVGAGRNAEEYYRERAIRSASAELSEGREHKTPLGSSSDAPSAGRRPRPHTRSQVAPRSHPGRAAPPDHLEYR
jgi:hypothetical protein